MIRTIDLNQFSPSATALPGEMYSFLFLGFGMVLPLFNHNLAQGFFADLHPLIFC
jgi:hypothetical protein